MKRLSEMTTDELTDILLVITPEIGDILQDDEIVNIFNSKKKKNENTFDFGIKRITQLIPVALKKHKSNIYIILGAFSGKTPEEIGLQNGMETIKQITELIQDKDLVSFFK